MLRRAGLPAAFFQQEKIYASTAELFAFWRAIGETSIDPAIGPKLGAESRFERYKNLTCPEEIRVRASGDEASAEFINLEADETQPDVLVDMGLSWILSIGRRGTDGQITPLRLELTRASSTSALVVMGAALCWS